MEAGQPEGQTEKDDLDHLFDLDDSEFDKVDNPWMAGAKPIRYTRLASFFFLIDLQEHDYRERMCSSCPSNNLLWTT